MRAAAFGLPVIFLAVSLGAASFAAWLLLAFLAGVCAVPFLVGAMISEKENLEPSAEGIGT